MADVSSGPVSSLPGAVHKLPAGTMCDDHPDVPAFRRVQGETDSFGAEYMDLCQACYDKMRLEVEAASKEEHVCDWCGSLAPLRPRRDYDEGLSGRVYNVCVPCIMKDNAAIDEELGQSDEQLDEDNDLGSDEDNDPGFDDYLNNLDE